MGIAPIIQQAGCKGAPPSTVCFLQDVKKKKITLNNSHPSDQMMKVQIVHLNCKSHILRESCHVTHQVEGHIEFTKKDVLSLFAGA